ncbi:spore maturation protein B [Thermoclostridium stercorarium subsp. stercorarium DSM 8532]|uniref:Spore maturation protein B n=1 Tax=Thermoclostridium stercorarium (strain ATCC 35414 / DSM 8532 / NCIMB 11754) TaxID=1121335 RepID=L7VN48_THES1|nr:nucleoside recognition domain-containing protein [Thermoclostridium stercorarium]AGC68162.1 spore maturation protein B [Thermoclostridium stercorarium subsp. stercorarium DSM 8532]AGI39189.1 membrane protein [Thermoclostridium stercorarium subsp. stercorarium DSM 8532]
MTVFMSWISKSAIPALIIIILLSGIIKKVPVFDTFLEGAREGLETTVRILPVLVGIMLGIEILSSSGALDMIVHLLKPLAAFLKIPEEILPMAIIRPISGSASLGLLKKQLEEYGPDSLISRTLSVIMGSTETIFYTITVYYGAIGVKKTRYTLWVSLIAAFAGLISAVVVCRILQ